jgi:4-hydroxybenzoate polyprenyltransferase
MLYAILKTMRPKQWAKNALLFAGLVFDQQLTQPTPLLHTAAGFALFCILASAVYILNDLSDVNADRQHPKKRLRPIASGALPVPIAWAALIALAAVFATGARALSPWFAACGGVYFIANVAYSRWLKHVPVVDVILLALFYVLRVAAGVVIIEVARFSPWIYTFTIFLALFLGVGKRRAELKLLEQGAGAHRKVLEGYTLPYLDQLITIVITLTIITYSLYSFSAPNLPENHTMMLTIPFVIFGMFRYLYLIQVQNSGGAPEDVLFSDRPLQVTLALYAFAVLAIFYYQ